MGAVQRLAKCLARGILRTFEEVGAFPVLIVLLRFHAILLVLFSLRRKKFTSKTKKSLAALASHVLLKKCGIL